jgi:hypothetical protein
VAGCGCQTFPEGCQILLDAVQPFIKLLLERLE